MSPNEFKKLKWWERFLFCCYGTEELKQLTYQSVVVVPLFVSFVLNTIGIYGKTTCIIALGFLAIYAVFLVLGERHFTKHFSKKQ